MNHRKVKKTIHPGKCASCVHCRVYDLHGRNGNARFYCTERQIAGKHGCEKHEYFDALDEHINGVETSAS